MTLTVYEFDSPDIERAFVRAELFSERVDAELEVERHRHRNQRTPPANRPRYRIHKRHVRVAGVRTFVFVLLTLQPKGRS